MDRRLILQDGRQVRAKAGKSIDIFWFPIPACFEIVVTEWVRFLRSLGFTDEDALFPPIDRIKLRPMIVGAVRKPVPVMSTTHAVTEAFASACRDQSLKFSPHSAKHCISAERDTLSLTQLERKAWSENMGHDIEQTTERYYGKLSKDRRVELLEHISANTRLDVVKFSDEDKIAFFDAMLGLIRKN